MWRQRSWRGNENLAAVSGTAALRVPNRSCDPPNQPGHPGRRVTIESGAESGRQLLRHRRNNLLPGESAPSRKLVPRQAVADEGRVLGQLAQGSPIAGVMVEALVVRRFVHCSASLVYCLNASARYSSGVLLAVATAAVSQGDRHVSMRRSLGRGPRRFVDQPLDRVEGFCVQREACLVEQQGFGIHVVHGHERIFRLWLVRVRGSSRTRAAACR